MKAIEQNFPVELFSMLYKVVLTLESVDDIQCGHSNGSFKYNRKGHHSDRM